VGRGIPGLDLGPAWFCGFELGELGDGFFPEGRTFPWFHPVMPIAPKTKNKDHGTNRKYHLMNQSHP